MLRNYFKTITRILWKNKGFSVINITGLAVGMAGAVLILLWIQNEMSYDLFHEKKDRLYEVWNRDVFDGKLQCWNSTAKILGPTLKQEYPEIAEMTRLNWGPNMGFLITYADKKLVAPAAIADPGFLTMFSFPLLKGNVNTALNNVYSVVVTQKLAKKIFGEEDPMNKIIRLGNNDNFSVTGVMKDLPNNTGFDFEYLLPYEYTKKLGWYDDIWGNNSTTTFVELTPAATESAVDSKIKNITKIHSKGTEDEEVFLHPLIKLHLYSRFENGKIAGGKIETVRLFWTIAAFILLIACINFMNLSTARGEKRAKEVGIRKVNGAGKKLLIAQFIGESVFLSLIAGIIALIVVQFTLPAFNVLVNKQLIIPYGNLWFWSGGIVFVAFTGFIAGSYPAFYLSSFKPVSILKGTFKAGNALVTPRKILVIIQFTFAIFLIISTNIIRKQIQYAEDREAGFDKTGLLFHNLTGDLGKNYELVRNALIAQGIATAVCVTSTPITRANSDTWGVDWPGKDPNAKLDFDQMTCRRDFVKTMGLKLISGRDIDINNYPTDSAACMFNETGIKAMGLKGDPIGQTIKNDDVTYHIVGVFRDFIFRSPYQAMRPLFVKGENWDNTINFRFNRNYTTAQNLSKAEKIFRTYNPAYPFEYHFADEEYAIKFKNEQQTKTLGGLFAALAIFISCLGLFGLSTYMAETRIKEIGVRKVLGASLTNITGLLSRDFLKLVIISILISTPIAWWAMDKWLRNYNYRVAISLWIFLDAGLLAVFIALITVSYQCIKAALANPVKSLRSE